MIPPFSSPSSGARAGSLTARVSVRTLAACALASAGALVAATAPAQAAEPSAPPAAAEPAPAAPFSGDFSWMNGNNNQPSSLLTMGPLTWTLMVDTYYGFDFNRPADHTVFPTTTAPRHNEVNLNMGLLGVEVTGVKDVIGKLVLQTGNTIDTITGTDATASRGAYAGLSNMRHVQQAYVGYHMDVLHGLNLMTGLFPAFIGPESYWPQENWNYTHFVHADSTPYYMQGAVAQLYPRPDLKTELWLVNGWQSLSKFNEGMGLGYSVNWRPHDRLSLTHNFLGGQFDADASRSRLYTNNVLQWKYAEHPLPGVQHLAVQAVADYGIDTAGTSQPATSMGGVGVAHRTVFNDQWASTVRGSFFNDPQKLLVLPLPNGLSAPDGNLTLGEATVGVDYKPSPWLLYRLEYRHDFASLPYIAGPGGVTPPTGYQSVTPPAGAQTFTPDLRTGSDRLTANATVRF